MVRLYKNAVNRKWPRKTDGVFQSEFYCIMRFMCSLPYSASEETASSGRSRLLWTLWWLDLENDCTNFKQILYFHATTPKFGVIFGTELAYWNQFTHCNLVMYISHIWWNLHIKKLSTQHNHIHACVRPKNVIEEQFNQFVQIHPNYSSAGHHELPSARCTADEL